MRNKRRKASNISTRFGWILASAYLCYLVCNTVVRVHDISWRLLLVHILVIVPVIYFLGRLYSGLAAIGILHLLEFVLPRRNKSDRKKVGQLYRMIKCGDLITLRRELDSGLDPNSGFYDWTLLMVAAQTGNCRIGELLLERGANVNHTADHGYTALSLAASGGHIAFLKLLLSKGASTDCRPLGWTFEDWMNRSGQPREKIALVLNEINTARQTRNE